MNEKFYNSMYGNVVLNKIVDILEPAYETKMNIFVNGTRQCGKTTSICKALAYIVTKYEDAHLKIIGHSKDNERELYNKIINYIEDSSFFTKEKHTAIDKIKNDIGKHIVFNVFYIVDYNENYQYQLVTELASNKSALLFVESCDKYLNKEYYESINNTNVIWVSKNDLYEYNVEYMPEREIF